VETSLAFELPTVSIDMQFIRHKAATFLIIGVREGILLAGRKNFALKITICPKNRQFALKLTF